MEKLFFTASMPGFYLRHFVFISLPLFAAMGFWGCSTNNDRPLDPEETAIDTAAIIASIDSLGAVVQKAHDSGDEKILASTWAKDGILTMAGHPPVTGRENIVAAMRNLPPLPPGGQMEIHPLEIEVLNGEWAYVFGIDSLKYAEPGTGEPRVETSTFFVLVRKTDEGWQTYREILTPNQTARQ